MPVPKKKLLYQIPLLTKALDVLELVDSGNQAVALQMIYSETGIAKSTAFNIVSTLVHRGYLTRSSQGLYRSRGQPSKLRFAFVTDLPNKHSDAILGALYDAALANGIHLTALALRNSLDLVPAIADYFTRNTFDLVLEFQVGPSMARQIGSQTTAAGIPLLAIDIAHPPAVFFGVDNYKVGVAAGEALAKHAVSCWGGEVDTILGLDHPDEGQAIKSRIAGAFAVLKSYFPGLPEGSFVRLDCRGSREQNKNQVISLLKGLSGSQHLLVAAATNDSALGAADAVRQLNPAMTVAIVGQDCEKSTVAEMLNEDSPLIGSISYEVKSYGLELINLGCLIVEKQCVPPYNYVACKLISRRSLTCRRNGDFSN